MWIDPIVGKIQPFENVKIYKEMYGHPDAVRYSVRMAIYISLLILPFLNRCMSVKTILINTKLGDFVNLCVLFLTEMIPEVKTRRRCQITFSGLFNAAKNISKSCLGHTKCLSKYSGTWLNSSGVSEENRSEVRKQTCRRAKECMCVGRSRCFVLHFFGAPPNDRAAKN